MPKIYLLIKNSLSLSCNWLNLHHNILITLKLHEIPPLYTIILMINPILNIQAFRIFFSFTYYFSNVLLILTFN